MTVFTEALDAYRDAVQAHERAGLGQGDYTATRAAQDNTRAAVIAAAKNVEAAETQPTTVDKQREEYDEARSLQAAHYRAPHNGGIYPKTIMRPFLGCSTCSNVTLRTQIAMDALHVTAAAANYEREQKR